MTPQDTTEALETLSRVFERAAKVMAQERLQSTVERIDFLTQDRVVRITDDGLQVVRMVEPQ